MLCVRQLSGRELVTATEVEVAALADEHGNAMKGIEQILSPLVGQPRFRLKLLCEGTVLNQDATLKLPIELQVTLCHYVDADAGDVQRLIKASRANDSAAVEALLRRPQDTNLVDSRGGTALNAAARGGALESAKLLVTARADLDKPDERRGTTAVLAAARNGHLDVVRWLIEMSANKDKAMNRGATPVFIASHNGHFDVVSLLIEMRADKDKAMNDGSTRLRRSLFWSPRRRAVVD